MFDTAEVGIHDGAGGPLQSSFLTSQPFAVAPASAPGAPQTLDAYNNSLMALSAWVKCAAPSGPQAAVVEWGGPGPASSITKIGLSVTTTAIGTAITGNAQPVRFGVCGDGAWHHIALSYRHVPQTESAPCSHPHDITLTPPPPPPPPPHHHHHHHHHHHPPHPPTSFPSHSIAFSCFLPSALPGNMLWYDGADPTTIVTSGNAVTLWRDKSGLGQHAVGGNAAGAGMCCACCNNNGAPTYPPTFVTQFAPPGTGIQFGGNNPSQYMAIPNGALPFGDTPFSYYIVASLTHTNAPNGGQVIINGGAYNNGGTTTIWGETQARIGMSFSNWESEIISPTTYQANTPTLIEAFYQGDYMPWGLTVNLQENSASTGQVTDCSYACILDKPRSLPLTTRPLTLALTRRHFATRAP